MITRYNIQDELGVEPKVVRSVMVFKAYEFKNNETQIVDTVYGAVEVFAGDYLIVDSNDNIVQVSKEFKREYESTVVDEVVPGVEKK